MVSEYEAAKLRRDMHKELDGETGAMVKCAIGILVVVLLAIVSPTLSVDDAGSTPGTAAQTGSTVARHPETRAKRVSESAAGNFGRTATADSFDAIESSRMPTME